MNSQQPKSSERSRTQRHFYNPAFQDGSMERHDPLPQHGTHYEFSSYEYPEKFVVPAYPQSSSPTPVRRIPSPRPNVLWNQGDYGSEPKRIPLSDLAHGGQYVVHHVPTVERRYGESKISNDEMDMEHLLQRLPSRQLDEVAVSAAKSLNQKQAKRKSALISKKQGFATEDMEMLEDMFDADEKEKTEEAVRSFPATMVAKRSIRTKLNLRKREAPNLAKRIKYSIGMWWKHLKNSLAELRYSMDLWHSHMKKIEGNFGSDVLSYFLFLKWLLVINIPTLFLTVGFIVIPQLLHRWFQQEPSGYLSQRSFTGLELLTGEGWFADTELYYGYYTNGSVQLASSDKKYYMHLAYLFTCGGYYLLTLFILGQSILQSYKKYYIEAGDLYSMHIVLKVLSSWNFSLTSPEAIKLNQKNIYNEIKEFVFGLRKTQTPKTWKKKCQLFTLRVATNLFCLGISAGCTYLVYYMSADLYEKNFSVTVNSTAAENSTVSATTTTTAITTTTATPNTTSSPGNSSNSSNSIVPEIVHPYQRIMDEASQPLLLLVLPVSLGAIHLILPLIFSLVERFEQFENPKTILYVHLFRSMLLRIATLSMCVIFWYRFVATDRRNTIQCWESYMGQDLYRLVIVDFIFMLLGTFFAEFIRRLIAKAIPGVEHPTFAIARNTLELIYAQALCWIGTFFSPLLTCIVMLKLVIIFYVKMVSVLRNCRPSEHPWRASHTHTVFLGFLIVIFLCTSAIVAVGIIFIQPSSSCGPFQGLDRMYTVVPDLVKAWEKDIKWLGSVIKFISSPGFIGAILIAFGTGVYLVRTIMKGHMDSVQQLKQQLGLEGKDKKFLINLLNQVNQREQIKPRLTCGDTETDMAGGGRVFVRQVAENVVGIR